GERRIITIAIFGAGGNMRTRASQALLGDPGFRVLHVEPGEAGRKRLQERGVAAESRAEAVAQADSVLLAVPDHLIGKIAVEIVPSLRRGTLLICLEPAAPFGGKLPRRDDVAYFVTHPGQPKRTGLGPRYDITG